MAVNEIAKDALSEGEYVRALLESSGSYAKGSVLGRFEWNFAYEFASQASSEGGACLRTGFSS